MNWLGRHRLLVLAAICALWTGVVYLARELPNTPFISRIWTGQLTFEDVLRREGRTTAERPDFVFLGIDQQTLELPVFSEEEIANNRAFQLMTERPFPWSREVWAILLDRLFEAGARLVMFDVIFSPPNDGDPAFAQALEKYRDRVVVGLNIDAQKNNQLVLPNETLIPADDRALDDRVGYVNFWPDSTFRADVRDEKVRSAVFTVSDRWLAGLPPHRSDQAMESFAARGLTKLGYKESIPRDMLPHPFRFSAGTAYLPRTLYEVFDPKFWQANFANGTFFKDKVVMIGASSQVAHDFVVTPMSENSSGPGLHLQTMAATMAGEFLRPTSAPVAHTLIFGGAFLAWLLVALVRKPLICLLAVVAITAAYLGIARWLYDLDGLLLFTIPVLSAFLISSLFSLGFEFAREQIERMRTRRTLERYVSKNLVREILDNPGSYYNTLKGSRMPATVLFSDIVGFTTMTESADPETLVKQLNEYLSKMVGVVFENNGTLDKFIGDAIMAVWGNVRSNGMAEDARAAAKTALGMRRELRKLNEKWMSDHLVPLGIGIGINQGDVLVGNIGSEERMDPTVIGDAVNLASRLEGLTRTYGVDILLGPTATDLVRDEFHVRSIARVQVKGKTKPVEISTLIGHKRDPLDEQLIKWLESYEEAMEKFRARDFTQAKILLSRFLEFYPDDFLAKMYLDRSLEYEKEPPNEEWNAVEVFKKK